MKHQPKIFYLCPDTQVPSAGVRRLYRHVDLLCAAGFDARILHCQKGFQSKESRQVPISYLDSVTLEPDSIIVIPEGLTSIMQVLKDLPIRRFVIALNWDYIYKNMPDGLDWRRLNIERAMAVSAAIAEMITWSMGIPAHLIHSSIDHQLYRYHLPIKEPQLSFIKRKGINIEQLKRMLQARNQAYTHHIQWIGLEGLTEAEYAAEICKSSIFLNTSLAEGYPTSCLEAMAAGTLVVSHDSFGGREMLTPEGPHQNCLVVPNGDYISLAYALEPVLKDLMAERMDRWGTIITNGLKTAADITAENERASVIAFWQKAAS